MSNFTPTSYRLVNIYDGATFDDAGWSLDAPNCQTPSLIRADYQQKQIQFGPKEEGLYRFADWLPIRRKLRNSSAPVTYRSSALAEYLGLKNLYICFNGYRPEIGANMTTCSFKETEAYSVCGRMNPEDKRVLVVSSAGNTARAFAKVCSDNNIPLLLTVPEDNLNALWFDAPLNDCVKLVASASGSDYFDAINLGNIAVKSPKFYAEGGAKNIARRDGMATTVLSAAEVIGRIPDYYFQAVGSGTGAIAAWEANQRLIQDGRFGNHKMRLIVSQNIPFTPMYDAWKADSRAMLPLDDNLARIAANAIDAKVLSNRKPPYSICGGLYDALCDSEGTILCADNESSAKAAELFEQLEGIDIHPAAGVALASLIQCVNNRVIDPEAVIMLNITGGGEKRYKKDKELHYLKPSIVFPIDADPDECLKQMESLF